MAGALFGVLGVVSTVYSGLKLPSWLWFTLFGFCALWVFYRSFHDVRLARDAALADLEAARRQAEPRVVLRLGRPYVRPNVRFADALARENASASFAFIPVWNQGTDEARDVIAWIAVHDLDGNFITNVAKAHWADRHVAGQRSITLPANADPHALDLVMRINREQVSWLYDDESPRSLRRETTRSRIWTFGFTCRWDCRTETHRGLGAPTSGGFPDRPCTSSRA